MTDATRRAIRTFAQAFIGTLIGSGILSATVNDGAVNGMWAKKVAVSACAAGFAAVVALVQNMLEDSPKVALPALLKAEASSGANPVTVDPAVDAPPRPPRKRAPAKKASAKKKAAPRR